MNKFILFIIILIILIILKWYQSQEHFSFDSYATYDPLYYWIYPYYWQTPYGFYWPSPKEKTYRC